MCAPCNELVPCFHSVPWHDANCQGADGAVNNPEPSQQMKLTVYQPIECAFRLCEGK